MTRHGLCWPTARQRELLHVAFDDPEDAAAAWARLRPIDPWSMEDGTYAVLPLVYHALADSGDPQIPWLKGTVRKTWYDGQLLLATLARGLEHLGVAGIEPVVVGGAARVLTWYPRRELRPTPVGELLVRAVELAPAAEALEREGWHVRWDGAARLVVSDAGRETIPIAIASEIHPMPTADGAALRERSTVVRSGDLEVRVLQTGDELLYAIGAGVRNRPQPSIQWLVDVLVFLRSGIPVDWESFGARVAEARQTARVRDAFDYIRGECGVSVPPALASALAAGRATPRERLSYRLASGRPLPRRLAVRVAERLEPAPRRGVGYSALRTGT